MNYSEIYESAVNLIGEAVGTPSVSDYETRAGYIMANVTTILIPIDAQYMAANGLTGSTPSIRAYVEMNKVFPLSSVFVPAATLYVAAMLVLTENAELSASFYELYRNELTRIRNTLSFKKGPTVDKYALLT